MSQSIHDFHDDPRHAAIRVGVNGALKARDEFAVFDAADGDEQEHELDAALRGS